MLEGATIVWFALTAGSVVFVVWDSIFNGVTSWFQRIAWILVTIYTGPVGAFFYLLACRRPLPGTHDAFTAATWKQSLNSEMHCLAGDATGIVVAASILPVFSLTNGWDATLEYLAGFVCGLFIFQALMMVGMYEGDYWKAVRKTFFAETVSMNMVMAGMIPVMLILGSHWTGSKEPQDPSFWFRTSMATIVGGLFAYPINHWLVANRMKHGCMTPPEADRPAPGLGNASPEPSTMMDNTHMHYAAGSAGAMYQHHDHAMNELPAGRAAVIIAITFAVLLGVVWLTSFVVPVRFQMRLL
ncbi:DUF4396 domain-containing protein [Bradyrhizobium sp. ARR65]|uniref:DUF4396 domain-containing protein n=1 Tax=Bradyrhizobium sp. ARR65 TaxID=1040989 RepID=UPI000462EE2E|nr:DUF4396 domain-containing protein [Bradyrhizobium sp. ARR65]